MKAGWFCLFVLLSTVGLAGERKGIDPAVLAKKLHLSPASKAMIQWKRIFKTPRKLKRYHLDRLTPEEREVLEKYLIDHAIDSDQPTLAGEF